jgi:hypothetical protein
LLVLAAIALTPGAKAGTIVFSNISGATCKCALPGVATYAEQFTPNSDFTLLDVAALMGTEGSAFDASFYILADSGGLPGGVLTQLSASIPDGSSSSVDGVFTSGAPTIPLTLLSGTPYWFAISLPEGAYWYDEGTSFVPYASASAVGGPYAAGDPKELQFEVDGDPLNAPEPGVASLVGLGLALLAGFRRR